jgi:hypothetical protein
VPSTPSRTGAVHSGDVIASAFVITTGHAAWCNRFRLAEPSSTPLIGPGPRLPTTTSVAFAATAVSSVTTPP